MNLTNKSVAKSYGHQYGASIVGVVIGLVVGTILVVAVALPITNELLNAQGTNGSVYWYTINGTTRTVVSIIPIMMAIIPVVLVAQTF